MELNIQQAPSAVLILADSNFMNLCKDPLEYLGRLKIALATRAEKLAMNICIFTTSGKYGLGNIDGTLPIIDIDDKNKTAFGQTLENASLLFEELVVITNVPNDPYISMVREMATNTSKIMTQYKYERKKDDRQP